MFRFKRSVNIGYNAQGLIYFYSRMYAELPSKRQKKIDELCARVGAEHADALREFVTTDAGATAVCMKHFISRSTLERAVRRYYAEAVELII